MRVLCSAGCQAMKCYHKKYFPSQFTHKSVRQTEWEKETDRDMRNVGQMAPVPRLQSWCTLLPHHTPTLSVKVTNRVAIKFHMLITCVLATHTCLSPSLAHSFALTTNGTPSKKLSKVLLFFFSLGLRTCLMRFFSARPDDANRQDAEELTVPSAEQGRYVSLYLRIKHCFDF